MDVDAEESLVARRPRRSTAGNRMEAALAELGLEDLSKEPEDDKDFFVEKDEEDIFGSDFESTDEETAQADVDAGEKVVEEEAQKVRKATRTRLERITAAAHERNKATFNRSAGPSKPKLKSPAKVKGKWKGRGKGKGQRVSFANVDGGEEEEESDEEGDDRIRKRHSRRTHTVRNTSATASRMKTAEQRRASLPKKAQISQKSYTQSELLARALDTEEGNIAEHRGYLKMEEEKRKRARVVRPHVQGPLVRWVSRAEEVKVVIPPPPPAYGYGHQNPQGYAYPGSAAPGYAGGYYTYPPPTSSGNQHYPNVIPQQPSQSSSTPASTAPPPPPATTSSKTYFLTPQSLPGPNQHPTYYYASQPPPPLPLTRKEKVCKNYVVHELSQTIPFRKPLWQETMTAMFGGHANWADMKVWTIKQRPFSRPKQFCPITGLQARYLDPRTQVPFANARAYRTLTKILNHEYVWSQKLGCYTARAGERRAQGIEGKARGKDPKGKRRFEADADAMDVS